MGYDQQVQGPEFKHNTHKKKQKVRNLVLYMKSSHY
jgi:hypothetical protein